MQTITTKNRTMPRTGFAAASVLFLAFGAGAGHAFAAVQSGGSAQFLNALQYPEGRTHSVKFTPTFRLGKASGEAKVERKQGMTEIEIELDEMKTALHFGGDFATYVLWAVAPEGSAFNLGEFVLNGNRSKLDVSTHLQTFAMMVTAEPHFMVQAPSRFTVLVGQTPKNIDPGLVTEAAVSHSGESEIYRFTNASLGHAPESSGKVRTEIRQANVAIQLAERAAAETYAEASLGKARRALEAMILAAENDTPGEVRWVLGREAIRLAESARRDAVRLDFEARHESEKQDLRALVDSAQADLEESRTAFAESFEAGRQREVRLEIALGDATTRTEEALAEILETRQSARGLIVSLPDILFKSDKATIEPNAVEVLSRVAGILQVVPELHIQVEGHTDSVGVSEYNSYLSDGRANVVKEYLVGAGIPASRVSAAGFGETQPVAPNDTREGRERNRRVELVIIDRTLDERNQADLAAAAQ